MTNFFKGIGKGLFNIVIIPFWAVGLVLSAALGLIVFLFQFLKKMGCFFTGRSLSCDLPEDIEAKKMIEQANKPKEESVQVVVAEIADQNASIRQNEYRPTKSIPSNEEVDFLIGGSTLQIDNQNTRAIENKDSENNQSDYSPKGSKF